MTLYVFNEVCSEGWKYGNEAIPEVFIDEDQAIKRGYDRYCEVFKEHPDNLEEWVELISWEEFYKEAKNGKGRCIVIQLYDYHYQYEFYEVELNEEISEKED